MSAQNMVVFRDIHVEADVTATHSQQLGRAPCKSNFFSAMLNQGCTQAALASQWGQVGMVPSSTPQKKWSRGCKRACVSFWPWPLLASWLLARKKLKKKWSISTSPSRSSRPTPANTSKTCGRARRFSAGPALTAFSPAGNLGLAFSLTSPLFLPQIIRGHSC